jgi:DNA-binding NtrC family response regulator
LRFSDGALRRLQEHRWPGNVFELREVIETVTVAVKGQVVETAHLDAVMGTGPMGRAS